MLTISPTTGLAVMNVRTGGLTPVVLDTHGLLLVSELRWQDAQTLVAIGATPDFSAFHEVILPLAGGSTTRPLALNGFPISLSPRGGRVLIARVAAAGPEAARLPLPRVREVPRPSFRRAGPAVFDVDTRLRVQAVSINFRLAVVDLASGAERVLGDFPAEEGLSGLSWSPGENRLALVHGQFPDFTRGGVVTPDSPTVQDGLGRLAPQDNPFFTSNALEIFDLGGSSVQRRTLRPGPAGGPIFVVADWSSDGDSLVALMSRPSRPRGRAHPSYGNINASAYRVYSARGRLQTTLDRPEIDSPFSLPLFVSSASEQAQIVAQLVARGFTSPDRVGVTGCSYGGYFASQSITRRPNVYAAANAQCSLLDLVDEWNTGYTGFIGYLEGRALDEEPDEYRRDSPVFNAARVKTPTLLFAGTEDFLPWEISLAFHDGIEAEGTDARFLVFAGEPHGLRQPTSQFVAGEAQLLWFRQHLHRD